ncbi:MAG: response regulator [Deltaproteobacteria bacterium]|nr:response regulator [Deltaproteobacteria bacterium]
MKQAKVLVVDDMPDNRMVLNMVLVTNGYNVVEAEDGEQALEMVRRHEPDVIFMDLAMPKMDGLTTTKVLKSNPNTRLIPVVILTAATSREDRIECLEAGADDYLHKPFHRLELLTRLKALTALKRHTDEMDHASAVLQCMAQIVEQRDHYTAGHCASVAETAVAIGSALGVPNEDLETLRLGGLLHDLGKIGVPDVILHKPTKLDDAEMAVIRTHPLLGDELLKPLHSMQRVRPLIRSHHERLDGTGYPDGLKGLQIPLLVRILSVADVYTALASQRRYKPAFDDQRCLSILREEADRGWWDNGVVEALAATLIWPKEELLAAVG